VSATASVWLIVCASLLCMLFSSKLVIVVVNLKEVCEFIITYNCGGIFSKVGATVILGPFKQKSQEAQAPLPVPTPMVLGTSIVHHIPNIPCPTTCRRVLGDREREFNDVTAPYWP